MFALRDSLEAKEVAMAHFERGLLETRASVTEEMEREYGEIEGKLKQEAFGSGGMGFVFPGMLTPRGTKGS